MRSHLSSARLAASRIPSCRYAACHDVRRCKSATKQHQRQCTTKAATVDRGKPVKQKVMVPAVEPRTKSGQSAGQFHGESMSGLIAPLGAHFSHELGAHNFVLYSSTASAVSLVLFHHHDLWCGRSSVEIPLDPYKNRTGDLWHIAVPGLHHDLLYGMSITDTHNLHRYRIKGAHEDKMEGDATIGLKHDDTRVLLDPYATSVVSRPRWGERGNQDLDYENPDVLGLADTWPQAGTPLPDPNEQEFDWQGDRPLNLPMNELVIYEAHVRGFTADHASEVACPGSYMGMVERLDYLRDLGVTAIELLPIFEFNELEYYDPIPGTDLYRYNFWGYSTVAFFAPMARFSAEGGPRSAQWELKMMVREAHRRGMEVILDVVFNHTAEGNELGPHISFRGIDNRRYYMLAPEGQYYNYSGCGNTFNCNDPIVRHFILDCLRFWVQEYHIDGFRFDLASILTRAPSAFHPADWVTAMASAATTPVRPGEKMAIPAALHSGGAIRGEGGHMTDGSGTPTGTPVTEPPVIAMISEDPLLRTTKLIAEAWDCDGLNQVGAFPHYGGRWAEWNGQFRDTVRQFIKGTDGDFIGGFASALMGSPELYQKSETHEGDWWGLNSGARWRGGRGPNHSINFVTAHDGFTLADSVAYNNKHNTLNGEDNNDGETHNLTWNCGAEGVTEDKRINALRQRQQRNLACALLLAQGIPMILMGDEYGHTKDGNNNTYCHDSKWNYVDWRKAWDDREGLRRFWSHLIKFRHKRPELGCAHQLHGEVSWHGERRDTQPEWGSGRFIGMMIQGPHGHALYAAWNTKHEATMVELPDRGPDRGWRVVIDTGKPAPYDVMVADHWLNGPAADAAAAAAAAWTNAGAYALLPWSCVVLECVPVGEVSDVRGDDRWNEVQRLGREMAASASESESEGGWSSDEGGPPVDPVELSELPEKSTLTFGQGLLQQGFAGEVNKKPTKSILKPKAMAVSSAPRVPARPPPGPAANRPREMMYKKTVPKPQVRSDVARMGNGEWSNAEEQELRALSEDLLGNIATLEGLSLQEKREMLQILRENLALRNRLST